MTIPQPLPWGEIDRQAEPVVWREDSRLVVSLRGEQDMSTATVVAETLALARAVAKGDVVIDLRDVAFMDSTIVTVLVRGRNRMRAQERDLTVRCPSRPARRMLDLCGLDSLIDPAPEAAVPAPEAPVQVTTSHVR